MPESRKTFSLGIPELPRACRREVPPCPIQQHDIVLELDRQEPLVRRPRMQTPQGLDRGSGASLR